MGLSSATISLAVMFAVMFCPITLLVGCIMLMKRFYKDKRVSPLTKNLLRPAGYSLQQQVHDQQLDLFSHLCIIPLLVSGIAMQVLLGKYLDHSELKLSEIGIITAMTFVALGYYSYKAFTAARKLQHLRLGYACELAVGQELETVVRPTGHPYRVYHDIPFDGFNIDHLVVGQTGVFVIETKGRSKPVEDGDKQFKVRYENNALHFPNHVETKPLEQTKAAVESVRRWLSEATGFDVPVAGILVLPGWYVDLKQKPTCPYVVSGSALPSVFNQLKVGSLELGQVKAISYQVEQRVRDVTSK